MRSTQLSRKVRAAACAVGGTAVALLLAAAGQTMAIASQPAEAVDDVVASTLGTQAH